jgi:hypothetical protein
VTRAARIMTCYRVEGVALHGVCRVLGFYAAAHHDRYIISTANSIAGSLNKYEIARSEMLNRVEDFLRDSGLRPELAAKVGASTGLD